MPHHDKHGHDHQSCGCGCGGQGQLPPASRDHWAKAAPQEMVCPCLGLNKAAIVRAIQDGACTLPLLKVMTGAGRGADCARLHPAGRSCEADLAALLALYAQKPQGWPQGGCGR